jgi:hypothetical protein
MEDGGANVAISTVTVNEDALADNLVAHNMNALVTSLAGLNIPFLGDYLWVPSGDYMGMYPILEASIDGTDTYLDLVVLADDTAMTAAGGGGSFDSWCYVPAIINPCTTAYVEVIVNTAVAPDSVRVYPGFAFVEKYSEIGAGGFPFTQASW